MTKIDIFSGFLGAGKTTLIKKLVAEAFKGEKLVIIENEFGEIGIDGGFLKDAGIEITEMNSGCICCSLVGDFGKALKQVLETYHPDRIIIEPSGVGKLSDVIKAVKGVELDGAVLNSFTTVADATKVKIFIKNFGEFYNNQIEYANCIILSRTQNTDELKLDAAVKLIKEHNDKATIIVTPWDDLSGEAILNTMEHSDSLENELESLINEEEHHHHHHHYDEDGKCACGHHHDDDDDDDEHEHHHDEDECCHHHEHEHHHHHEDGKCSCGHEHHHADEVFTSWGVETAKKYTENEIKEILDTFTFNTEYGTVLRAKGIVASKDGKFIHFDYVPGESNVRIGSSAAIGRLCVIGSGLNETKLAELFNI